jgi:hypothetical protein
MVKLASQPEKQGKTTFLKVRTIIVLQRNMTSIVEK